MFLFCLFFHLGFDIYPLSSCKVAILFTKHLSKTLTISCTECDSKHMYFTVGEVDPERLVVRCTNPIFDF